MKAFTQLGSFEGRGSMEGWLTRITTNTCLNMLRSAKRRPELASADLSEDESTWLENQLSEVAAERHRSSERSFVAADLADRVLENLSPDDRVVLTLIDGEDASVKEVAELTGWSESKVKVQAFRARRRMRAAVEKLLGSSPIVGEGLSESPTLAGGQRTFRPTQQTVWPARKLTKPHGLPHRYCERALVRLSSPRLFSTPGCWPRCAKSKTKCLHSNVYGKPLVRWFRQ